jgi:putative FmdB family regulatory protein
LQAGFASIAQVFGFPGTIETVVESVLEAKALPLYPYRCTECGHKFEKIQSFSAEPETECPKCKGKLERPLTAPALSFKGAGWYVNDYASKGSGSSSESSKSESKTETKAPCGESAGACASCPAATAAASS